MRAQFPAFSESSLEGWGFFENAGGSYACRQVIERLTDFYQRTKVQPYYNFPASVAAGEAMDEAYERLAAYLGVFEDEVHLGPSTSQNTYVLAQALRAMWQEGDEIVVSNQDHEANAGVWRRLEGSGIIVREWKVDVSTGCLQLEKLDELLSERTVMVAFPHCSNVVADINPVEEVTRRAHRFGAITVVDGVSYAPHGFPDIGALGADIYLFSLYKTYGPHLGLMTVRRDLFEKLPNQGHYFNDGNPRKHLLPAGPDHAQIAAAAGVALYFDALHAHHWPDEAPARVRGQRLHELFRDHETKLLAPLLDWLDDRSDIRLVGPADPTRRAPTVAFYSQSRATEAVLDDLTDHRIMAGNGHFYAVRPLDAMGVDLDRGVVRLSFVHYTTEAEVEQLMNALENVL